MRMKVAAVLLVLSSALLAGARGIKGFAEWYATNVYPRLVSTIGRVFGLFPFSVTEVLLYIAAAGLVVCICWLLFLCIRKQLQKKKVKGMGATIFLVASVLFFLYTINCGINYYRVSFSECSGITAEPYTAEELKQVCVELTQDVNQRSNSVERDADGVMQINQEKTRKYAVHAMKTLAESYPEMEGYYPEPKGLLCPFILSIQNLTGVYSPFTIEANYNTAMTDYNIPFTACHELSHLRGFMQEEEANFIAYLACMSIEEAPDGAQVVDTSASTTSIEEAPDGAQFQYSGSLMGWIYCMNVLRKVDAEAWTEVRAQLCSEAEADLEANNQFWAMYDGRIAEASTQINDNYLKANGQEDGVKSYDRMVDLLVTYKLNAN